jgi:hypothetical protein
MVSWVPVVGQVAGVVAMLVALLFAAGVLWVVFAAGVMLLVVSTAAEMNSRGRH